MPGRARPAPGRPTWAPLLLALALLGALAACAEPGEQPDADAADDAAEERARLDLAVSLTDEDALDHEWTLVCRADDATVDGEPPADYDPQAACTAVEEHAPFLVEGPDPDRVCTQEYGGPEEADLAGAVGEEDVDLAVDRTDGCGIDDWERLEALLGPPAEPAP